MIGCLKLCAIPVVLLAVAAGVLQLVLLQPKYAEAAVRAIVELGSIPQTVFDHLQVIDETAWSDIILKGNLGIAEGYMHGKIKVDPLKFFITVLNGTSIGTRRKEGQDYLGLVMKLIGTPTDLIHMLTNQQSRERSRRVTTQHYDAGNDLYERMLGPTMSYSCAYWRGAETLEQAQTNKFNLIFRKLELTEGMKVADMGMGWGTAAAYMHEHGKVQVTGVSLSEEQVKWAKANLAKPGLDFIWQDYRDLCENPAQKGTYDRVYSIGFLEHVGCKNFVPFFKCVKALLKPEGLAVMHTIGEPDFVPAGDPFLEKYIFPGGEIPTLSGLTSAFENDFILEDFQNFGHDYARTLAAWAANSEAFFRERPEAYSKEFQRMWEYYLKMCESLFELRVNQLWHLVLSPRPTFRLRVERQT